MYDYRLGLLFLVIVFTLSPVVMDWWSSADGNWYRPFLIWFIFIIGLMVLNTRKGRDEL